MSITVPEIKGFVTREQAGLRKPTSVSRNISPQSGGVALHYGGWSIPTTTHASCIRRWKSWQDYHMGKNWVDIAYTMGVCQHGYAFAGRGAFARTAGQGTNEGNRTHYAVCWIGGEQQKITSAALSAYAWCINELRSAGGAGKSVKPHRYFNSTGCPGNDVAAAAKIVDGKTINAVARNYIMPGDNGPAVKSWQQSLIKWDSNALPKFKDDGDFGGETTEWTVKFMDAAGMSLSDRSNPLVGPLTLKAMDDALSKPEPEPEVRRGPILLLTRIDGGNTVYHVSGQKLIALRAPTQVEVMVKVAGLSGRWQDFVSDITSLEASHFDIE